MQPQKGQRYCLPEQVAPAPAPCRTGRTFVDLHESGYASTDRTSTLGALGGSESSFKWKAMMRASANDALYAVPFGHDELLRIDPANDTLTLTPHAKFSGSAKWGFVVEDRVRGALYCTPHAHADVLKVDVARDDTLTFLPVAYGPSPSYTWQGDLECGRFAKPVFSQLGVLYAFPKCETGILRVDPATDEVRKIGAFAESTPRSSSAALWSGAVMSTEGVLYGVPAAARSILRLNPVDDTYSLIGTGEMGALPQHGLAWSCGFLYPASGAIFMAPSRAAHVLKLEPATDALAHLGAAAVASAWDEMPSSLSTAVDRAGSAAVFGWAQCFLVAGDSHEAAAAAAYCMPAGSNNQGNPYSPGAILKIALATGAVSTIALDAEIFPRGHGTFFTGSVWAAGSIYSMPMSAETSLLKFNVSSESVTALQRPSSMTTRRRRSDTYLFPRTSARSYEHGDAALSKEGVVYVAPGSSPFVLKLGVPTCFARRAGYSGTGAAMTRCPAGTFQDLPAQPSCKTCPPGRVQRSSGQRHCLNVTGQCAGLADYVVPRSYDVSRLFSVLGSNRRRQSRVTFASDPQASPAGAYADVVSVSWPARTQGHQEYLYFIPSKSEHIVRVNVANTSDSIELELPFTGDGLSTVDEKADKFSGGVMSAGTLFMIPSSAGVVVELTPGPNDKLTAMSACGPTSCAFEAHKWAGGVRAASGRVFGVPYKSNNILLINVHNETLGRIKQVPLELKASAPIGSSAKWFGGALSDWGDVLCAPHGVHRILSIRESGASLDSLEQVLSDDVASAACDGPCSGRKLFAGAVASNGLVFFIPFDAHRVIAVRRDSSIATVGFVGVAEAKWAGGNLSPSGILFATPYSSSSVLRVDTQELVVTTFGYLGELRYKWLGGTATRAGQIFAAPFKEDDALQLGVAVCSETAPPGYFESAKFDVRPCPLGKYQDKERQSNCNTCAIGQFTPSEAATTCETCAAKYGSSVSGAVLCKRCELGRWSDGKHGECTPCLAGEHGNEKIDQDSADHCSPCGLSEFQNRTGQGSCVICPSGKSTSRKGSVSLSECKAGAGQCGAGYFMNISGSCNACPAGKFQPVKSRNVGQCEPCGSVELFCGRAAVKQERVPDGYVSAPATAEPSLRSGIQKCPPVGMACYSGQAHPTSGYWLPEGAEINENTRAVRCLRDSDCTTNGTQVICHKGHSGILCGICEPGFGKAADRCVECPSNGSHAAIVAAFVLGAIVAALVVTRASLHPDFTQTRLTILRIFVGYAMQTATLSNIQIGWGALLEVMYDVLSTASGGTPPLTGCGGITAVVEVAATLASPYLIPLYPVVCLMLHRAFHSLRGVAPPTKIWGCSPSHFRTVSLTALGYLVWPGVVQNAFRALHCVSVPRVNGEEHSYLIADLSVECGGSAHTAIKTFAM